MRKLVMPGNRPTNEEVWLTFSGRYKRAYRYEKKLNNNEEAYEWVTKQLSLERSSHGTADDTVFEDTPRSVAYLLKTLEHDQ